jgi:AcrR family transcriptional regulator
VVNTPEAEDMGEVSGGDEGRADGTVGGGLPPGFEVAWGLRERPNRGPRRGLSLERIVAAAVGIAAREGLAAVSMSRVAAELGAATMSLYRYVDTKDELLALMVDAAYGSPPEPPDPGTGWREGMSHWAWAQLAAFRRHPWTLRVPIAAPPATPRQVQWLEQGLRFLDGTGLAEQEKLSVILLVSGFVRNWATLTADLVTAATAAGSAPQDATAGYGHLLARVIDPARFPAVSAAIASGALDDEEEFDNEFVFGLERILDGVDVLVRARS